MATLPHSVDIRDALKKLEALETAFKAADLSELVRSGPAPAAIAQPIVPSEPKPKPEPEPEPEPELEPTPKTAPAPNPTPSPSSYTAEKDPEKGISGQESPPKMPALNFGEPALKPSRTRSKDSRSGPEASQSAPSGGTHSHGSGHPSPISDSAVAILSGEVEAYDPTDLSAQWKPAHLESVWELIIAQTMDGQIRLGSLLRHSKLLGVRRDHAEIAVPDDFHKRMLTGEKSDLAALINERLEVPVVDLNVVIRPELFEEAAPTGEDFDARAFLKKKCEENPAIRALVERFGGEIVW